MNITGIVISGNKAGRLLGFPTANIKVSSDLAVGPGIYAGYVIIEGKECQSALYLAGNNIIEAFILDFSENVYDQEVQVKILKKIRDKQDFKSDKEAINQIAKDVVKIKEFFQTLLSK